MSLESDQKLILSVADTLIVNAGRLTKNDPTIAVAALGIAMMTVAKADGITRAEINALIDLTERELADA